VVELGKFFDMGRKFQKRDQKTSGEFLKNIAQNGLFGSRDSKKCHHPIILTMPFIKIENTQYYSKECRDCGKIFAIFKK